MSAECAPAGRPPRRQYTWQKQPATVPSPPSGAARHRRGALERGPAVCAREGGGGPLHSQCLTLTRAPTHPRLTGSPLHRLPHPPRQLRRLRQRVRGGTPHPHHRTLRQVPGAWVPVLHQRHHLYRLPAHPRAGCLQRQLHQGQGHLTGPPVWLAGRGRAAGGRRQEAGGSCWLRGRRPHGNACPPALLCAERCSQQPARHL